MKGGKQGPSRPNLPNSQVLLSLVRGIKEARQGQTDRQTDAKTQAQRR